MLPKSAAAIASDDADAAKHARADVSAAKNRAAIPVGFT
jgi:hypothetical protein